MQSTHHSTEPPAPTPEVQQSEFVGIVTDLARAWRAPESKMTKAERDRLLEIIDDTRRRVRNNDDDDGSSHEAPAPAPNVRLLLSGLERLDGAITTLGFVMMTLSDSSSAKEAIRWVFEGLRQEAENLRDWAEETQESESAGAGR